MTLSAGWKVNLLMMPVDIGLCNGYFSDVAPFCDYHRSPEPGL
jgi:hypothetical protein